MMHAKRNHAVISIAALVVIATATAACSHSPNGSSNNGSSTAGKGGDLGQSNATQVEALMGTGISQADQENWAGAAATFQDVLAINPDNYYASYDLGVVAQNTGNPGGAISYYNRALADNGGYTPAMYNEAILLEKSQPHQAIALYKKIVSLNPRASTAYLRMAFVQAEEGDLTDAEANHAKADSINPAFATYKLPAQK